MGCTLKMTTVALALLLLAYTAMAVPQCSSDADCGEDYYGNPQWCSAGACFDDGSGL